jgi:hypothetical protein
MGELNIVLDGKGIPTIGDFGVWVADKREAELTAEILRFAQDDNAWRMVGCARSAIRE